MNTVSAMQRIFWIGCFSILLCGCGIGKKYKLTIYGSSPSNKIAREIENIWAGDDTTAYKKAVVYYELSLNAYKKMDDNAKAFITRPDSFALLDIYNQDVDSILGDKITGNIRNQVTIVNENN